MDYSRLSDDGDDWKVAVPAAPAAPVAPTVFVGSYLNRRVECAGANRE